MAESHVVTALVTKRAEMAGLIERHQKEVGRLAADSTFQFRCEPEGVKIGRLDVLVYNAGIEGVNKPTDQLELAEWEKVMAVNTTAVFLCTKHAIAPMRQAGGGSIINISSIYGIVGGADIPPYHASNGAVPIMSKNDALTLVFWEQWNRELV